MRPEVSAATRVANAVSPSPGSDVAGYSFASVRTRGVCAIASPPVVSNSAAASHTITPDENFAFCLIGKISGPN